MSDILAAMTRLNEDGIESFEKSGILIIPCTNPDDIFDLATRARRIFKEIRYEKSWQVDPYYYQKKRYSDGSVVMELGEFV